MNLLSKLLPTHAALSAAAERALAGRSTGPRLSPAAAVTNAASPADVSTDLHVAKYIVVERDGREHAILFPRGLQHADMVPLGTKPVSAGFYQVIGADNAIDTLFVFGMSTSLHLMSRPLEDRRLIEALLEPAPAEVPL